MSNHVVHDAKNFPLGSPDEEACGPYGMIMQKPNNWVYPFGYILEDGREIIPEEYSLYVSYHLVNGKLVRERPVVVGKIITNENGNTDVYVDGMRVRRRTEEVDEYGGYLWFPKYYMSRFMKDKVWNPMSPSEYRMKTQIK